MEIGNGYRTPEGYHGASQHGSEDDQQTLWEHGIAKPGQERTVDLFSDRQGPSQHAQSSSPNSCRGLGGVEITSVLGEEESYTQ